MPNIIDFLGELGRMFGLNQQPQLPSYPDYANEILNLPFDQQTTQMALKRAIELRFPRPMEAAEAVMKIIDTDRKRLKETMPQLPESSQPVTTFTAGLLKSAGIPTESLTVPMLPERLPTEMGLQAIPNVETLPRRYLTPEEGGFIPNTVLTEAIQKRFQPSPKYGITQIPVGTETQTFITDPISGLPVSTFAIAPREILSPRDKAFSKLTPAEQREALLKPEVEIKLPSPGEREKIEEVQTWQSVLYKYRQAFEKTKASIGPVYGRGKYKLYTKAGGKGLSKEESEFFAAEAKIKNIIIPLVTGAAVGKEEETRILSEIPQHSDTPEQWLVKYRLTIENAIDLEERIKNIMGEYGIGIPSKRPSGTIKWLPEK